MLGDAPIEEKYERIMEGIARAIDRTLNQTEPKQTGFILMLFPFGSGGRCNYISNAEREDVVEMLKEQVRYFEEECQ